MKSLKVTTKLISRLGAAGILCIAFAVAMTAQEKSRTETTQGPASKNVQVERGEVVYVSGNDLVVRMENGEVRHFPNIPESARATVDGKQLSIHELRPGMKLERTIATTTTPRTVTTVRTVEGKVWQISPPNTVILTLADGTNKQYKIPKGQKFMIEGQEKTAFELKKGMNVSVTAVSTAPETVVAEQRRVTGSAPPPPPTPAIVGALLIDDAPAPRQMAAAQVPGPGAEPAPKKLPKTASPLPLVGLMGLFSLAMGLGLRAVRRWA